MCNELKIIWVYNTYTVAWYGARMTRYFNVEVETVSINSFSYIKNIVYIKMQNADFYSFQVIIFVLFFPN